jgi:GAF domain-containing protein
VREPLPASPWKAALPRQRRVVPYPDQTSNARFGANELSFRQPRLAEAACEVFVIGRLIGLAGMNAATKKSGRKRRTSAAGTWGWVRPPADGAA